MKKLSAFVLPCFALSVAFLLLGPAQESHGFSTLGGTLPAESQRDWRVFDNFADGQTNNNTTPHEEYPGWLGAEMALWKAASEWASRPHGDGSGDPSQSIVGSGGANFDFVFSGTANDTGGTNNNIVSAISSCGGGTLAFVETPISNGWRMRVCDNWAWSDGPEAAGPQDLQGVATHEFGHSLGLGHSSVPSATMFATSSGNGSSSRSLDPDDIAGVQFLYNEALPTKLQIYNVDYDDGTNVLTINGDDFSSTNNAVWFTNANVTSTGSDPRVIVSGISSSGGGSQITLTVPGNATDGDVHVKGNFGGGSSLSNGFPLNIGAFDPGPATPPNITVVNPDPIEALLVGTAQSVSISGTDFTSDSILKIGGELVDSARYSYVDPTEITVDMPILPALGATEIEVINTEGMDSTTVDVVAPSGLLLQINEGDGAGITSTEGMDVTTSGPVGSAHYVILSNSSIPSVIPIVSLDLGNNFSDLEFATLHVIPANGVFEEHLALPPVFAIWFFQSISLNFGTPIPTSNLQSVIIIP